MKKVTLLCIGLLSYIFCLAQWNTTNNDIYFNGGNVGIGTQSPTNSLHIDGDVIRMVRNDRELILNPNFANLNTHAIIAAGHGGLDNGLDLRLQAGGDDSQNGVTLKRSGNVGIGTINPYARLEISNGDIYISDINKGIILKSPDGSCWRGLIDNNGTLNFTSTSCPDNQSTKLEVAKSHLNVKVFPNPFQNQIGIYSGTYNHLNIKIYNSAGVMVIENQTTSNNSIINVSDLNSGFYIVNITNNEGLLIASEKIIKH